MSLAVYMLEGHAPTMPTATVAWSEKYIAILQLLAMIVNSRQEDRYTRLRHLASAHQTSVTSPPGQFLTRYNNLHLRVVLTTPSSISTLQATSTKTSTSQNIEIFQPYEPVRGRQALIDYEELNLSYPQYRLLGVNLQHRRSHSPGCQR